MKCPICDGMGTSNTCVNGTFKPCSFCGGTGEVKDNLCETCGTICPFDDEHLECDNYTPLTNEGWLRTATTEQLAEYLASTFDLCGAGCHHCFLANVCLTKAKNGNCLTQEQMIVEWLKQPHTTKEQQDGIYSIALSVICLVGIKYDY